MPTKTGCRFGNRRMQVAIVGAGIVGLAHAWSAAERGHEVAVFERSPTAEGATVRNFGMVWPIGQPSGECQQIARVSRDRWCRLEAEAGLWLNHCGSLHLAHRADEWAVLEEFAAATADPPAAYQLLTAAEVQRLAPAAQPEGLLGGLFSRSELGVNPRHAARTILQWLQDHWRVKVFAATAVTGVHAEDASVALRTAAGTRHTCDRVLIASGADFHSLYPEAFAQAPLRRCKLQMLKTAPQPPGWRIGPHLASGLTLRHYRNFEICPSLPALRARIAAETPELDELGIHVMASQLETGEVILGDSHEYGDAITPFDQQRIDDLILREVRRVFRFPVTTMAERWHGVYAKHPAAPVWEHDVAPGVTVVSGTGGAGMTMSFGLAERWWARQAVGG